MLFEHDGGSQGEGRDSLPVGFLVKEKDECCTSAALKICEASVKAVFFPGGYPYNCHRVIIFILQSV